MQIEGTDMVGNVGKNIASYEVLDSNPIPSWLNDLINPDNTSPTYPPDLTTNTGLETTKAATIQDPEQSEATTNSTETKCTSETH